MSRRTARALDLNGHIIRIDLEGPKVLCGRLRPRVVSDVRYNLVRLPDERLFVALQDSVHGYVELDFRDIKKRRVKFAELSRQGAIEWHEDNRPDRPFPPWLTPGPAEAPSGTDAAVVPEEEAPPAPPDPLEVTAEKLGKAKAKIRFVRWLAAEPDRAATLEAVVTEFYKLRLGDDRYGRQTRDRRLRTARKLAQETRRALEQKECPHRLTIAESAVRLVGG